MYNAISHQNIEYYNRDLGWLCQAAGECLKHDVKQQELHTTKILRV